MLRQLAFVAVDEGMVTRQSEGKAGGKVSKVWRQLTAGVCLLAVPERRIRKVVVGHVAPRLIAGQMPEAVVIVGLDG